MTFNIFTRYPIPEITDSELLKAIAKVRSSESKETAIKKSLKIVENKFRGYRFMTYVYFWKAFDEDPNHLWCRNNDFMHCHHQNFLVRVLLIKSSWFKEKDISYGYSLVGYVSPHQWLKINLKNGKIAVDPWNHRYGAKWNQYAGGFGFKTLG